MTWLACLQLVSLCALAGTDQHLLQTVDVNGSFAAVSHLYGTELLLVDSEYRSQRSYRFEDFFWTGSGDGSIESDSDAHTDPPTTIYKTQTILSTVYVEAPTTQTLCPNCQTPEIIPTPTVPPDDDFLEADRQFWLLTVLKTDGKDPVILDLKNSLAKLYKIAFQRQQDKHLGIVKRSKRAVDKPVKVYIHEVQKSPLNGDEQIQVLYHVSVSGKPVDAFTAAEDMTLISDDEVTDELGYPFLIKAEPYLKPPSPQGLSKAKNTWIFIGVSIATLFIILLFVAFLTLALTKRKNPPISSGLDNRKQVFEEAPSAKPTAESPTYINFRNQPSNQTIRSDVINRPVRGSISSSSSSSTSLDISPLMGLTRQRTPPRKPPRPKAAVKRIAPEFYDSDSSGKRGSPGYDAAVISPSSYLSMPSLKAFPRGAMPEPLNKVLEPVSVLHLDMPDEEPRPLARCGSIGAVEDPGVIGPLVWNMHCQRLQHGVSVDEGINDLKTASNVSRMRKRFHELLDDTFSLFGSRRESPVGRTSPIEVKSHSAINRPDDEIQPQVRPRPKTTDLRRVIQSPGASKPKGAWSSSAPSPLIRPLSADIPKPSINVDQILAEGKFPANDPAVPLIAAIKSEIEKYSLPGSTADLRQ